jgi:hypothetical protein
MLQLALEIMVSCSPFIMQQYQHLKLNPLSNSSPHSAIIKRWTPGELLCLARYCDRCFRVHTPHVLTVTCS